MAEIASDVLSPDQIHGGWFNQGTYIKATQAREIAARLDRVLRSGEVRRRARKGRRGYTPLDESLARDFKNFCRNCGGFAIW